MEETSINTRVLLIFEHDIRIPKYNALLYKYVVYYFISTYIYFDIHTHLYKYSMSHIISICIMLKNHFPKY